MPRRRQRFAQRQTLRLWEGEAPAEPLQQDSTNPLISRIAVRRAPFRVPVTK